MGSAATPTPLNTISTAPDFVGKQPLRWRQPGGYRQHLPGPAGIQLRRHPACQALSAWERQQQQLDQELDRRLITCRGCRPRVRRSFLTGIVS